VVVGGIVPVVNLPGIKPGQLVLDGPTLANIYLGKIKSWSDPAIKKLNPGANLPSTPIAVVHRSDGSGTTFNFATYLSRVSAEWKDKVGADTAIDWPTGVGGKGNEGVSGNVSQIAGSIGYVEYAYAKQSHLIYTKMINKAGKAVEPETDTFRNAAANADWVGAQGNDFYVLFLDAPGAQSWPISATVFMLVYKNPPDPKATSDALKFFQYGMEKGQQDAMSLDYVPLPENAVKAIEASWKGIQGSGM
jgi:phosphate transport system substrate-binding protein